MRINPKRGWFAAFTAVFAVCAAFVFWGTWSPSMAPVMPDCPTSYSAHWFRDFLRGWIENGKFAPAEAICWIGSPYVWTEFQYAFAAYMSALGLAWFLLGRGLPRVAAYGAGLLLAFSGYWFTLFSAGHLGWFQWMTYGVFVFGLVDRSLEKGMLRRWILLGACLAWGAARQPDMWLLFSAFSAVYFIFRLVVVLRGTDGAVRRQMFVRHAKGAAVALASLLAIGGASFRSAFVNDLAGRDRQIEEGRTVGVGTAKDDAAKRWIFTTNWSMPPEATKEFLVPGAEGDTSCPMTLAIGMRNGNGIRPYTGRLGRPFGASEGNYRQHSLYVGWLTCLMATVAVAVAFIRPGGTWGAQRTTSGSQGARITVFFFAAASVVFWLFSMGRYCEPVYRLVYALPFGDYLRAPVKWHHLTEFCLCVLAGYGVWGWLQIMSRRVGTRAGTAAAACVVVAGVITLVANDRLYCAPHRADCDLRFVDARVVQDPRGLELLDGMRARIVGSLGASALIDVPRSAGDGVPPALPRPDALTLVLGLVSLAGTVAVGACAVKRS